MRVLVACEKSQRVTAAFRDRGHEAFSCDLDRTVGNPAWHIQRDAREVLNDGWDLLIAHPPCTRLCNSGTRWYPRHGTKALDEAVALFMAFWNAPVPKVAVENPIPSPFAIEAIGRKYDQIVQPHFFGDEAFKATCLWLRNLPHLIRTHYLSLPEKGSVRHANWHAVARSPDSKRRGEKRAVTFPGMARAFADQWGAAA